MNCCKDMVASEQELARLKAEQGAYTLLGFCQKAGRLISGGDAVQKALAAGQVKLLLIAEDLSENTQKKLKLALGQLAGRAKSQPVIWRFGSKAGLSAATGRPERGIWAVCDENFATGLMEKLQVLQAAGEAELLDVDLQKTEPNRRKIGVNRQIDWLE